MWSDWQPGETRTIDWVDLGRGFRDVGFTYNGDWTRYERTDPSAIARIYGEAATVTGPPGPFGNLKEQLNGAFLHLPDTWKQVRNLIPNLLSTLEYGKDWGQIPDRPGEFVEYEPGDNTPVSTRGPSIFFISLTVSNGDAPADASGVEWALGVVTGAVAPPPIAVTGYQGIPSSEWPGIGTVFATGSAVAAGTDYRAAFPDITGATDIFLSARISSPPPDGWTENASFNIGVPRLTYQMPRWRYWIPRKPPLRLRQRDDNLSLNAGRTRNRASRQTTNRLRSYD